LCTHPFLYSILAIGHAGDGAAKYSAIRLQEIIETSEDWIKYSELDPAARRSNVDLLTGAVVRAFIDLDFELAERNDLIEESGCTCVCAIISPSHIVCASVGDSRCVIGSDGTCISMSEDHKPQTPEEAERIQSAGGFVFMNRVNGELVRATELSVPPTRFLGSVVVWDALRRWENTHCIFPYPQYRPCLAPSATFDIRAMMTCC
jgi:serine/threonine protein phosphatase PrpC